MSHTLIPIGVVLVTGDREWTDGNLIRETLALYRPRLVIEGEARGADRLAKLAAEDLGIPVDPHPAQWTRYGKGAGPIRNEEMLHARERPNACFAFHDDLDHSRGTKDMVTRCRKANVPVLLISHAQPEGRWMFASEVWR